MDGTRTQAEETPRQRERLSVAAWQALVGKRLGASGWHCLDQERISQYAACVCDEYWLHCDPERAAAESPTGGTIAHGLLSLSLISAMAEEALPRMEGEQSVLNYGFNRVRFVAPVPVNARLRGLFDLIALEQPRAGHVTVTCAVTIEREGAAKPAVVAEWLHRRILKPRPHTPQGDDRCD
ncbi:MAG: MaoC family dehydratase [Pseudomonadota bacterium]